MEFRQALLNYDFDRKKVENFLAEHDLLLDKDVEYTLIFEDNDKIIGTGSVAGNVLKCMALDDNYQGMGLSNQIVSKLIEYQTEKSRTHLFIFTKPMYKNQMTDFGFKVVAEIEDKVILLDNNINEIKKFTDSVLEKINSVNSQAKNISAIVMNANPFTKGHQYLAEYAAEKSDLLLVFVVKENKSKFPFDVRFQCVKEGLKNNPKIIVCDGGDYIISNATFPTYFLKDQKIINDAYSKLDATIFAEYIAKPLNIKTRFMGEEPIDIVTKNYNDNIFQILKENGIDVKIIPRKEIDGEVISASYLRKALEENNEELIKKLAPKSTIEVLKKWKNFY